MINIKLHEIIETLLSGQIRDWNGNIVPFGTEIERRQIADTMMAAQKFDLGDISDLPQIKSSDVPPNLLRLPYDNCYFETVQGGIRAGFWCVTNPDSMKSVQEMYPHFEPRFFFSGYIYHKTLGWLFSHESCFAVVDNGVSRFLCIDFTDEGIDVDAARDLAGSGTAVLSALLVMACTNVHKVINIPDLPLQKSRLKKSKLPFFEFWTLHISQRKVVGHSVNHEEPTRNSPRVHLRRGHIRRHQDGSSVWINQMLVGDKRRGFIDKDYVLNAT